MPGEGSALPAAAPFAQAVSTLPIPVGLLGRRVTPEPRRVSKRLRVHRRLRRYYAQMLVSAVGFGLIGALVGYRFAPLHYEAEAVLHFQALSPETLVTGEASTVPAQNAARFASTLEGYATRLTDPGNTDRATPAATEPQAVTWRVDRSGLATGSLRLIAQANDAATAAAAANARVRAFRDEEPGSDWVVEAEAVKLQRRQAVELGDRLARDQQDLERQRLEHGPVSIDGRIITLERRLRERTREEDRLDQQLAVFRSGRGVVTPGGPEADRVLDRLAAGDPVLQERLKRWRTIRLGLDQAARIRPELETWLLDRGYRQPLRELEGMVQDVLAETRMIDGEPVRRSELQRRRLAVRGQIDGIESELEQRQGERAVIRSAEAQITATRRRIAALDTQIAQATATLPVSARLTEPIQWAAPPRAPLEDYRPAVALVSGLAAAGLGALFLLPLALRDRSMRRPDPAVLRDAAAPLLASLPLLKSVAAGQSPTIGGGAKALPPPADPAEAAHAAAAIHDLRVLLESNAAPLTDAKTICLAAPATAAGVTSLTLGLSTALAQAGTRTLLVDLAGLASPRLSAAPADPTLDQALTQSRLLDPDEADLLLNPQEQRLGLPAFLDGQPLTQSTLETRLPTLHLLPSLTAQPGDPDRLAGRVLDRLHHEAQQAGYDAVLIDAGVVPGRADALLAAAAADATLLVLAPNVNQDRFNHALAQLRLVHAHVLGSVFNRVHPKQATTPPPDAEATNLRRPPAAPLRGSGLFAAAMGLNEPASFEPSGFGRHAGSGIIASATTSLSGMPYLDDPPDSAAKPPQASPDVFAPMEQTDLTNEPEEPETTDPPPVANEAEDGTHESARVLPRPIHVEADPDVDAFVEAMIGRVAPTQPAPLPMPAPSSDEPPQNDSPASADPQANSRPSLADRLAAAADELSEPFIPEPATSTQAQGSPDAEPVPEDLSDAALSRELQAQADADRAAEAQAAPDAQLDAAIDDLANEALLLLRSDLAKANQPNPPTTTPTTPPDPPPSNRPA
ncbi:MAG: hypothetical protein AAGI68_15175 [Planctomycetota bacterium]